MIGYVILAASVAFGALYLDDKHQRSKVADLTVKKEAAEGRVKSLEQEMRNEERRRGDEIKQLALKQASATAKLAASWRTAVNTLAGAHQRRLAQLEGDLHAYVTPAADRRCVVPVGALVFHDAAARGVADESRAAVPRAADRSVDADSGVQLSAAFAVVARNYAGAQAALASAVAEITAWRDWYVAQRALFQ